MSVRPDTPLIGIVLVDGGQETTHYFVDEAEADAVVAARSATDARDLAGVWSDLDWAEMAEDLDRIRHESMPTPPIDDL